MLLLLAIKMLQGKKAATKPEHHGTAFVLDCILQCLVINLLLPQKHVGMLSIRPISETRKSIFNVHFFKSVYKHV